MAKAKQETKVTETAPVVAQNTAIAQVEGVPTSAWGAENVSSKDLIIPKILLMQGMSQLVADGKAAVGQLIDSVSGELLGDRSKPMPFIPFYTFKTWITSKKKGEKYEYVGQTPMDATNEDLPVEFSEGADLFRRDRCINVYVLTPAALEKKEGIIPYMISFRRTSYQAGKKLSTHIAKLADFNQPPAARNFLLSVGTKENEKGKFGVFDIEMKEATKPEHLKIAYDWYLKVKNTAVRVDDSDLRNDSVKAEKEESDDVSY